MKHLFSLSALLLIIFTACSKDAPTKPEQSLNISGTWTGIGLTTSSRVANFEITIAHAGTSITGNGKVQLSGAIVPSNFEISGYCFSNGTFDLFFKDILVSFAGNATDKVLSGTIGGGSMEKRTTSFVRK